MRENDAGDIGRVEDGVFKAARELLRWTQEDLAEASGVGIATIRRERAGVVFVAPLKVGTSLVHDGVGLRARANPKGRGRRRSPKGPGLSLPAGR